MRDCASNHQPHDCSLNRLFRCRSKKRSKLRVTGLCVGNSPVTGEFPAQMASNAENVPIWWRHHAIRTVMTGLKLAECLKNNLSLTLLWFKNNLWFIAIGRSRFLSISGEFVSLQQCQSLFLRGGLTICDDRPMSPWWLQMSWRQIHVRVSTTKILARRQLWYW